LNSNATIDLVDVGKFLLVNHLWKSRQKALRKQARKCNLFYYSMKYFSAQMEERWHHLAECAKYLPMLIQYTNNRHGNASTKNTWKTITANKMYYLTVSNSMTIHEPNLNLPKKNQSTQPDHSPQSLS